MDNTFDGVMQSKLHYQDHEDKLYHQVTQPSESLILERNKRLRNNPGALGDLSFGRQLASIPFILWEKAKRDGYDLHDTASMMKWLQTEDGRKCLVTDKSNKYFSGS
jgi:hypothetical protein